MCCVTQYIKMTHQVIHSGPIKEVALLYCQEIQRQSVLQGQYVSDKFSCEKPNHVWAKQLQDIVA